MMLDVGSEIRDQSRLLASWGKYVRFNETIQLKTLLAKYSIKFNDLAVQILHINVCEKVCGQTTTNSGSISSECQSFRDVALGQFNFWGLRHLYKYNKYNTNITVVHKMIKWE